MSNQKPTPEQIETWRIKAQQWDELEAKIAEFYPEDPDEEVDGDLCDIGEIAASAFGFM